MAERTASFSHRLAGRPSITAEAVALARAIEHQRAEDERIVDDPFAEWFLGRGGRTALAAASLNGPATRLLKRLDPGGITYVACRHRYIDDQLASSLDAGAEQVVLLGAGYDTRAYRFADQLAGRPVFEVDLAAISQRKAKVVAGHAAELPPSVVHRVEIDFETQTLAETLGAAGFDAGARTFVAWEGVSMYLTRAAVKATMRALHDLCGARSWVCMDGWYMVDDPGPLGTVRRSGPGVLSLIGEAVTFGVHPEEMPFFLGNLGWDVVDLATATELEDRYTDDDRSVEPSMYLLTSERAG